MTTNPSKDYYSVLGVPKNATPEQIKQAYRKLVRKNHPDRFTGTRKKYEQTGDPDLLKIIDEKITQANEKTQEINEAYQTLSDPDKRQTMIAPVDRHHEAHRHHRHQNPNRRLYYQPPISILDR